MYGVYKILLTSTDVYHCLFAGPGLALCWLTSFHFDCSNTVFLTRTFFYLRIESNMAAVTLTHGKSVVTCTRWLWYRCNIKFQALRSLALPTSVPNPYHKKGNRTKKEGLHFTSNFKIHPHSWALNELPLIVEPFFFSGCPHARWVLFGIILWGVQLASPNPDFISDQNM